MTVKIFRIIISMGILIGIFFALNCSNGNPISSANNPGRSHIGDYKNPGDEPYQKAEIKAMGHSMGGYPEPTQADLEGNCSICHYIR